MSSHCWLAMGQEQQVGTIVRTRRFGRRTTVFAASVEKALREGQEEAGPGLDSRPEPPPADDGDIPF